MSNIIKTMPTYFGYQLYPNGMPLPPEKVKIKGRSIRQIFLDNCDCDYGEDDDDITILKDYYRYYLLAPCFVLTKKDKAEIMKADSERLFEIALDNGIDPL